MNSNLRAKELANHKFIKVAHAEKYQTPGVYRGNNEPFHLICPIGHDYHVRPASFMKGVRCRACNGQCPIQAEKKFRNKVSKGKFLMLSDYIKARTPVDIQCKNGHITSVTPNYFTSTRGGKCKVCSGKCSAAAKEKFTRAMVHKTGWTQLTPYKDTQTKIHVRCPAKHNLEMLPSQLIRDAVCVKCLGRTHDVASAIFYKEAKKRKYALDGEYVDNHTKINAYCPNGHKVKIKPARFLKGHGCRICAGQSTEESWERFCKTAPVVGYKIWQRTPVNSITKVAMTCPVGHKISMKSAAFMSGVRCGECHPGGFNAKRSACVYLLVSDCQQYVKCGVSNVPDSRISVLDETTPFDFVEIYRFQFKTGRAAMDVEIIVKRLFRGLRVFSNIPKPDKFDGHSEWFYMGVADVVGIKKLCVANFGIQVAN